VRRSSERGDVADAKAAVPPSQALPLLVHSVEELRSCWEVSPIVARGLDDIAGVPTVDEIEDLLGFGALRRPFFRMVREGEPVDTDSYTKSAGRGRGVIDGLPDVGGIRSQLAAGATLVLQGLRFYVESLDRMCVDLGEELGHSVHVNGYLTPKRSAGAGRHYDDHSVFVRQISGAKRWRVQAPVEKWPRTPCFSSKIDTAVVLETTLEAGDCLYLPRGFVHDGKTLNQSSFHLSFTLDDPPTWDEMLISVLEKRAKDCVDLRAILPMGFESRPSEVASQGRQALTILRQVLSDLTEEEIAAIATTRSRSKAQQGSVVEPRLSEMLGLSYSAQCLR